VRTLVSLEGFGIPAGSDGQAPGRMLKWLDAIADPPALRSYRSFAEAADRLQKTNPRLPRARAEFLARHWAEQQPDGTVRLRADARHKLPFPTVSHLGEWLATWRRITAPVLWVLATESHIKGWATKSEEEWKERMDAVPQLSLEKIAGAGHMLHHDQPAAVAKLIEDFVEYGAP
jgi:pimeloyl-ACP methyl ester carboxylesterase